MAKRTFMQKFARWHIWLGWAAAVPLVLWTFSGIFMALRPIDEVRGTQLLARPLTLDEGPAAKFPVMIGQFPEVESIKLVQQVTGKVWIVSFHDKTFRRVSGLSGNWMGPVDVIEARQLAEAAFAGPASLTALQRFAADQPPLDLRRPRPSWQATFEDGTHLYIDADTGEVLALRTRWWRAYDLMWGLHIMDPVGRENTSNWWLWLFAPLALITSLFGTTLLFRRRRRARP